MNREDIIPRTEVLRMAREAGLHAPEGRTYILSPTIHPDDDLSEYLERFAALVASAERNRLTNAAMKAAEKAVNVAIALEREACAKVAESIAKDMTDLAQWGATQCANSIRKRGQA